MNLFQTSPVVSALVDWRLQQRTIAQKGDIDYGITELKEEGATSRNEATNETTLTRQEMQDTTSTKNELIRDFGGPAIGFILGSSRFHSGNGNNPGSSSGPSAPIKTETPYEIKSREWDEAIKRSNRSNATEPVQIVQRSTRERLNDAVSQLYSHGNPFEISNALRIGTGLIGGVPILSNITL